MYPKKLLLIAAVPPILVKSASNPEGIPIEVFDGLRKGLFNDRSQFYKDFAELPGGTGRKRWRTPSLSPDRGVA